MGLECPPTPQEAIGAALREAKQEMASYQPPRLFDQPPHLGGCTPGFVVREISGGWCLVCYRPEGDQSYDVQRRELEKYQREVFTEANGWETMWNRRQWPGVAALLVRKAARDE